MKILVVSGEYPPMKGGVGRYTKNLVQAIAKKNNVEVCVAIGGGADVTIDRDQEGSNVTIYRGITRKGDKRNSDRLLH
ncbi:MAG: glycosyl transferase, partial [Thermoproteota archaeon]|nr:glycosyl transferase [Thermoproteota archaeon]